MGLWRWWMWVYAGGFVVGMNLVMDLCQWWLLVVFVVEVVVVGGRCCNLQQ